MIYPNSYENKIGFNKIRQMVENYCKTNLAKEKLSEIKFSSNYNEVRLQLLQTNEMKSILLMEDSFPQCAYIDIIDCLNKIKAEGSYMLANELLDLSKALHSGKDLVAWFNKSGKGKYPELYKLTSFISIFPQAILRIDETVNKYGQINDNASPQLQQIRHNIVSIQQNVSKKIQQILKSAQNSGIIDSDATISVRDGRVVLPVNAANKRKIKGSIHDESATGKTVYIEPAEIVELNNEIVILENEERREIIKILISTADFLRPYLNEFYETGNFIGKLDLINSKAKFCLDIDANMPIVENKQSINLSNAKHPLLVRALRKEGKEIVPLNISIDNEKYILLISGPNAGGKSVCLKTVGLLQYMLQCGFLVPVRENSEFGIFDDIFIDIGDEQSIENDLSTYSSHLLNMKTILRNATQKSLVLIDEFGSGTEPVIGGTIAEAILTKLTERKIFAIITTHYTNLKHFAANNKGIANGAMLFDTQKIQPLFKLETGIPGSSFAFEIARKIGLPEEILTMAAEKIGDKQMNIEKSLKEISKNKKYWQEKRNKIRITDKHLEEITEKYEYELKKLNEDRKTIIAKAKIEAENILSETNKIIENTIRTIKENQADKEKTKIARKQLDKFKEKITTKENYDNSENIEKKIEAISRRKQKKQTKNNNATNATEENIETTVEKDIIEIGKKVRIKGQSAIGEVIKIGEKNILINYGNIITSISADSVETVSNNEYKKSRHEKQAMLPKTGMDINAKRLNFKPNIDVRGMRAEEAITVIENFIDEAMMLGYSDLKILHGKGNGILKTQIRNFLKRYDFVKFMGDEHVDFGGAGVTIVKL